MDWRVLSRYFHSATGIPMNKWEFLRAGERIIKLERRMAVEMGLDPKDDTLPAGSPKASMRFRFSPWCNPTTKFAAMELMEDRRKRI
jgi:aldehyde:ferredoxin oxidoreductase